jgi:hypothetical protein
MGILRITLLFGSAAVALALIATPFLDNQTRSQFARNGLASGLDTMSTGSIRHRDTYTLRRSDVAAAAEFDLRDTQQRQAQRRLLINKVNKASG